MRRAGRVLAGGLRCRVCTNSSSVNKTICRSGNNNGPYYDFVAVTRIASGETRSRGIRREEQWKACGDRRGADARVVAYHSSQLSRPCARGPRIRRDTSASIAPLSAVCGGISRAAARRASSKVQFDGTGCGAARGGSLGDDGAYVADVSGGPDPLDTGESGCVHGDLDAGRGRVFGQGEAEGVEEATAGGEAGRPQGASREMTISASRRVPVSLSCWASTSRAVTSPRITEISSTASSSHCSSASSTLAGWANRFVI